MRVVVLGYIVRCPLGGLVWHHLQYVIGLARLGHDVYFMEDSGEGESCFDPALGGMTSDASYGLKFATDVFKRFGLDERWSYFDSHRNSWSGPAASSAADVLQSADLILNISGVNPIRDWSLKAAHRALVDTDPTFTQVSHLKDRLKMREAMAHTAFFTFGENFGKAGCSIPDDGLAWAPTRQPVVLDAWPVRLGDPHAHFSTVMQWESYPPMQHGGRSFGMKSLSFGPYLDLPRRTGERLELAVGSDSAPRECLREHGWIVTDPLAVARTPSAYQDFVRNSKAEFSVAKHGYQVTSSGWFSERSAAYLASGRPVVTQDTGFSKWLKARGGVLPFDSLESAMDSIQRVNSDYPKQCRQARSIAEEYFEAGSVLNALLENATRGS